MDQRSQITCFPGTTSHIASGYYLSGFNYAQGISYDASYWPEEQTSSKSMASGTKIESAGALNFNAGIFYDQCTHQPFLAIRQTPVKQWDWRNGENQKKFHIRLKVFPKRSKCIMLLF